MIFGIGNDMIEIGRIRQAAEKGRFVARYFTERERACFPEGERRWESIAGAFSAKEAVAKAMGTGFRGFQAEHIEILHDEKGQPYALLNGPAAAIAEKLGIARIFISITHCREYAAAVAVAEKSLE